MPTDRLTLAGIGLTRFPAEVPEDTEVLDLSGNAIEDLPEDLVRFTRLRVLFLSGNPIRVMPRVLGRMPSLRMVGLRSCGLEDIPPESLPPRLRWFILADNRLEHLPDALGNCQDLEKMGLAGNRLARMPDLSRCHRLALLRLSANRFESLPDWLHRLPALAWLGAGGNPCTAAAESIAPLLPDAPWKDLHIGELLGSGASGNIYSAQWHQNPVAVKLYKGTITSDGWPSTELTVWSQVGQHPHLMGMLARLSGHPQGTAGAVMPLCTGIQRLADPPSLDSCSRDVHPTDRPFTATQARRLIRGIAQALGHLHARGLLHGDAYGHNLLVKPDGAPILGDFGGAWHGAAYAATDVLALGHLIEEILARTLEPLPDLAAFGAACRNPHPAARPTALSLPD